MPAYAPSWAFGLQALDAIGDPHLAPGVHLRVLPGSPLGLPVLPLRLWRLNLGQPGPGNPLFRSTGLRFVDAQGQELKPPFNLAPDKPVTVHLPAPALGLCGWFELQALAGAGGIVVEAQAFGALGPVTVARATQARWRVAAPRIDRVLLRGAGTVQGGWWIDGTLMLQKMGGSAWRQWSLPVAPAPLYLPLPTAAADAKQRVQRGAPRRLPMTEAPTAIQPADAPLIAQPVPAETQRLAPAQQRAQGWLDALVAGGSTAPPQRRHASQAAGPKPVQLDMPLHELLALSMLDPGLARWAGFADVDEAPPGTTHDVVAYIARGAFQFGLGPLDKPGLQAQLAGGVLANPVMLREYWGGSLQLPPGLTGPFYDLCTAAFVTRGVQLAAPAAPGIEGVDLLPFAPATPPSVRREVRLRLKGLAPAAALAWARSQGGSWQSLNPQQAGRRVPVLASRPAQGAVQPGQGRLNDRHCGAEAAGYRVAQVDSFGRWSRWAIANAAALPRPRPPQPVLQLAVRPPVRGANNAQDWDAGLPVAGKLVITVPVPPASGLAPGSAPLTQLMVTVAGRTVMADPATADSQGRLLLEVPGPALARCAEASIEAIGHWRAGATSSEPSAPIRRVVHDPRPPQPVALDGRLAYASRPDATGRARVDLRWPAIAGAQAYRVYHASETALVAQLKAQGAALPEGYAQLPAPARAAALQGLRPQMQRDWFEPLTSQPSQALPGEGPRLVHEVSGELATLGLYRVAGISSAQVENRFEDTPMAAVAVPVLGAPAMPLLQAQVDPASGQATLTLEVPRGSVAAAHWRLRRSSQQAEQASQMQVVAEGAMPPAPPDGPQRLVWTDASLKPWRRALWRLEVRAADLPAAAGSAPLRGDWSRASAPAEALWLPATAPQPVAQLVLEPEAGGARLRFQHSRAALDGGAVGRFRLVLYRRSPGGQDRPVAEQFADAAPAAGGIDATGQGWLRDASGPALPGTVYRVVVSDPLGRSATQNPTITVPEGA